MSGDSIAPGTALPWRTFHTARGEDILGIGDMTGGSVAHLWRDGDEREANAAYIVNACNAYPTLKAQADALADALEDALLFVILVAVHWTNHGDVEQVAEAKDCEKTARAALAAYRSSQP